LSFFATLEKKRQPQPASGFSRLSKLPENKGRFAFLKILNHVGTRVAWSVAGGERARASLELDAS